MLTPSLPFEPARENPLLPWPGPADAPAPAETVDSSEAEPARAELVLVFASTTEVLNAEDRLEAEDLSFALIPVPKEVNPNCGLALSIPEEIAPDIDQTLTRAGLAPLAVYRRRNGKFALLPPQAGFFSQPACAPCSSE